MLRSHQSIGENNKQAKCVCVPVKIAGIDMTSQPESPRIAADNNEIARNVNAPVAAGPP